MTSDSSQGLHELIHECSSKLDFGSLCVNQVMRKFESSQGYEILNRIDSVRVVT